MQASARSGRSATGVALALAALGLAALTAALAFAFSRERSAPVHASSDAEVLAELRAQRELQQRTLDALERLGEELAASRGAPAADARRAVGEPLSALQVGELLRSLDALRLSFEAQTTRTLERIAEAPIFRDEPLSRVRERRRDVDWSALDALRAQYGADPRAADASQYFLSARELLEIYGPPSDIFRPSKGGLLFHYRRAPRDVEAPAWYFRVQDGFVVEFFVEVNRDDG